MPVLDVRAYLDRLGVDHPGPPSVAGLRRLHRAHTGRVPYENLEIQIGRPTTVDPYRSAARILRGRGGYCYHLNGAFSVLLSQLGYRVTWHVGGVQRRDEPAPPGATGNHLALTVSGLPAPQCPDGEWLVDVGLGDGLRDPLPLRPGAYRQGPFTYRLAGSAAVPGGWRLTHDPAGSFAGMDFAPDPAGPADFAAMHRHLSTSPGSPFVKVATVTVRDAGGALALRGCVLTRIDRRGRWQREITAAAQWFGVLTNRFGLVLDDLDQAVRQALWTRVRGAHERWVAAVGPVAPGVAEAGARVRSGADAGAPGAGALAEAGPPDWRTGA